MKIIFDLCNTGLGNGGGSLTLIKSANALSKLGCIVCIIDTGKNQHKWTKLEVPHLIVRNENQIPDADFIIGTGFRSWNHTINVPKRCGKKLIYLRGWETWQSGESNIVKVLSNKKIQLIVNSIGLYEKVKSYNIKSKVIRPGNDFDLFHPLNIRNEKEIILGGLYHTRHRTKRSDWAIETKRTLQKKYPNLKLFMFGTNKNPGIPEIDFYIKQPNIEEKNKLFNKVNIWLSASYLEGLHIVPQEALLTKSSVVTTNSELSGTQDYIIQNETGLISKNNLKDFIKTTEKLINQKELRIKLGENGRNKIINLGSRKDNMKKMIDYLESIG